MTRVLVVDDEPQILRALAINLRARHYEVETAATGAEALAVAAATTPTWWCSTSGLPDLDGVEVVRGLRGWTTVPIVDPVRAQRQRGQGRRRSTPAPTTTSPSPSRSTSCWPGCGPSPAGSAAGEAARPSCPSAHATVDLAAAPGDGAGRRPRARRPAHPDRVAPARGAAALPGQAAQPAPAARRGVGARATRPPAATCGSTWPSCAASSSRTRPGHGTCSPSRARLPVSARAGRSLTRP